MNLDNYRIIVTGGYGFIGSNFVKLILSKGASVLNLDALTYAANLNNIDLDGSNGKYEFIKCDISSSPLDHIFHDFQPDAIVHFAAESHVDNSIKDASRFIETNINGTYNLLKAAHNFLTRRLNYKRFRLIHISTDEVFGDLPLDSKKSFNEESQIRPSSPYSASKASSDHLVSAWRRTYNLPAVILNCSNNFGPRQNNEKFIPMLINNALNAEKVKVYGSGQNIRDWLFVEDFIDAICLVLATERTCDRYLIGANNEMSNINLAMYILERVKILTGLDYISSELVQYAPERKGHDLKYSVDSRKFKNDFNWKPRWKFENAIDKTINWYLEKSGSS